MILVTHEDFALVLARPKLAIISSCWATIFNLLFALLKYIPSLINPGNSSGWVNRNNTSFVNATSPCSFRACVTALGKFMVTGSTIALMARKGRFVCWATLAIATLSMSSAIAPVVACSCLFSRLEDTRVMLSARLPVWTLTDADTKCAAVKLCQGESRLSLTWLQSINASARVRSPGFNDSLSAAAQPQLIK